MIWKLILGFFRPAGLDFASGLAGLMGGIVGLQNAKKLPHPDYYTPQYGAQMDAQVLAAMQQIIALNARNLALTDPQQLAAYQAMSGIDLTGLAQAGAEAGQQYSGMSNLAGQYGNLMQGQAGQAFSAGQDLYNLGRDPQGALRERTQQRIVDANRAGQSARGIAMSPYGAAGENEAVRNFNIDWENQQLGRSVQGLQALLSGQNAGASELGQSMGYYGMQPGLTQAGAQAPIQAQQMQYQLPIDWAAMFQQAQNATTLSPQYGVWGPAASYAGGAAALDSQQYQQEFNRALAKNAMQQQSFYGLAGGGQSSGGNPYGQWGGNQSGFGNPMNWMGMGMGG